MEIGASVNVDLEYFMIEAGLDDEAEEIECETLVPTDRTEDVPDGTEWVRELPMTKLLPWEGVVSAVIDDGGSVVDDDNMVFDG